MQELVTNKKGEGKKEVRARTTTLRAHRSHSRLAKVAHSSEGEGKKMVRGGVLEPNFKRL